LGLADPERVDVEPATQRPGFVDKARGFTSRNHVAVDLGPAVIEVRGELADPFPDDVVEPKLFLEGWIGFYIAEVHRCSIRVEC
jgi:hypothetical protein